MAMILIVQQVSLFAMSDGDIEEGQHLVPPNIHFFEMTPQEAYTQLSSACRSIIEDGDKSQGEITVLELLTRQKHALLASKTGADLAFDAAVRYGTLDLANEYGENFGIWYRLNKDCLLRIWKDRGNGSQANGANNSAPFFKALTAAVERKDSKIAIQMTDFMFDQLWLGLHIWPQDSVSFFYDVFAVACEHEKRTVADHALQRWLSVNQIMGNVTTFCAAFAFFSPFILVYSLFFYDISHSFKVAANVSSWTSLVFKFLHAYGRRAEHIWPNRVFRSAIYKQDLEIMQYLASANYNLPLPGKALLKNPYDYLNDCMQGKVSISNEDSMKKASRQELINIIKGNLDN